jgi:thiamine biosynthesis lipoprotein
MLLTASGCVFTPNSGSPMTASDFMMDTVVTISLYGYDDESFYEAAFDEIRRLEQLLSRKQEGSDLSKLAEESGKGFVPVSPDTVFLFKEGEKYSRLTGGLFDVTIGPLVSLWDISGGGNFPSDEGRLEAMALINYESALVNEGEAMLEKPGMEADFGSIAKGYIADKVKALLARKGVTSCVINLGGDIVLIGAKPNGEKFKIGVRDPGRPANDIMGIIETADMAVVSSGAYERFFIHEGKKYHHILDPKTGFPVENELEQVTVISNVAMVGDAISTSALLLGLEKGMELINNTQNT